MINFQKNNIFIFLLLFISIITYSNDENLNKLDSLTKNDTQKEDIEFQEMVKKQLEFDKTIPLMQKGVLFVPYLVDDQREPSYLIYDQYGKYIKAGKPGHRVFLDPGKYSLLIGSGPKNLRFTKEVVIEMEQLTIVKPDWSALIVDTVDQFGNRQRKGYLLYDEESKFLIVTGFGADASKGERTAVWILPPHLYRITKRNETSDSLTNYITVRTVAGKASYSKMVFDSETDRILGGGETTDFFFFSSESGWSFNNLMSGVFSFTSSQSVQGKQDTQTYSFGVEIKSNTSFDKEKYYFTNRLEIFEYFQSTSATNSSNNQETSYLVNTKDTLKNNLVGIYRISNYLGPYMSLALKTNLFRHYAHDLNNIKIIDSDNNERILTNVKSFAVSDYLGSTSLQEGAGLNLEYKYTTILSLFLRLGYGLKQDISRNVYVFNESNTELKEVDGIEFLQGPEISFYLTSSPFSFLDITIDILSLIPNMSIEQSYFTFQSTVMLKLSSFISLNYNLWIERNGIIDNLFQKTHALTIQLYYRFY